MRKIFTSLSEAVYKFRLRRKIRRAIRVKLSAAR